MPIPPIIEGLVHSVSPAGFVWVAVIANIFPFIPEEVFLLSFGYLAHATPHTFPFLNITIFLIIGFLFIDSVLYYLVKRGSKIIDFIIHKIMRMNISGEEEFFKKHIRKTIFVSRFLLQLRALGPIAAGRVNYPYFKFLFLDFLALILYVPGMMALGYYFSNRLEKILSGADVIRNIILIALIMIILIIFGRRIRVLLLREIKSSMKKISKILKNSMNSFTKNSN